MATKFEKINSLEGLVRMEKKKYLKGFPWGIFQLFELYLCFYVLPGLIKPYYEMLPLDNPIKGCALVKIILSLSGYGLVVMCMIPVYKYKIPFFEQFKINPQPWLS
jgi:hypothetical protein